MEGCTVKVVVETTNAARVHITSNDSDFFDRLRLFICARGLAYATEKTYLEWIRRFIKSGKYTSSGQMHLSDVDLGHESIETTQIYTHVVGLHERGIVSPADLPGRIV